jgi:XapX domain-containing protein
MPWIIALAVLEAARAALSFVKELAMKLYLLSLGAGLLVGIIYSLLNVRSPAPPVIALIGLFCILIGEQSLPRNKRAQSGEPVNLSWFNLQCMPHMFGHLPSGAPATAGKAKDAAINDERAG